MRSDLIGFGTLVQAGKDDPEVYRTAALSALDIGYRTLDTALRYENEVQVGQAIAQTDVAREDITVTTKIPGRFQGYHEAKTSIIRSLNDLKLPFVDAALIHWPLPDQHKYVDTWRAMIEMRDAGLIRTIGVSNFLPEHLQRLADETGEMPAINQVEMHPYFGQAELRAFHDKHDIATQAWSPLGRTADMIDNPVLTKIGEKHATTPVAVVLAWHVHHGSMPLPASSHPERQRANLFFDVELDTEDLTAIDGLERGRIYQDPAEHEEF
ncbi:MAG: aldo/keto reductase [Yaniella sp.]|uniref:aldo/keto reductase n=1 Tax=Yaniella sp. TaxID=2773929 RepID=UPI002649A327|nr:aldo/keto reductase [Yaniella sp.]MDN5731935.1 aldo/keto reductase [Yaniella sp.]MDN5742175.1 aldo/keto reductase [Yaniella sp.]MDN5815230.1 aldo/keto reductase [Yaniella sp.]MDN5838349.1 aldo/keto reductase [Yaniella sp.]MDN5888949.1 aldo/keto reductase [Yaniella sp.]